MFALLLVCCLNITQTRYLNEGGLNLTLTSDVINLLIRIRNSNYSHKSRKRQERTMAVSDANDSGSIFVLKFELALYILMIWFKHSIFSYRQAHCSNYPLSLVHQHKLFTYVPKQKIIFSFAGMLTASQGLEEIATRVYNTE